MKRILGRVAALALVVLALGSVPTRTDAQRPVNFRPSPVELAAMWGWAITVYMLVFHGDEFELPPPPMLDECITLVTVGSGIPIMFCPAK